MKAYAQLGVHPLLQVSHVMGFGKRIGFRFFGLPDEFLLKCDFEPEGYYAEEYDYKRSIPHMR